VPRRSVLVALIVAQGALALAACRSAGAGGVRPARPRSGGVAASVFADDAARDARRPGPPGVLGELERRHGGAWAPVFRSLDPSWTVVGLPPGAYRTRVRTRLDDAGRATGVRERMAEVEVRDGMVARVEIVLQPSGALVAGAVAVATAAAVMHEVLDYDELRKHGAPAKGEGAAGVGLVIDLRLAEREDGAPDREGPVVTSHFPSAGALVAPRRPRIVLALSEPLRDARVPDDAVAVRGEASGLIAGATAYDPERWWIVWQPKGKLPAGQTIHVTLGASAVADVRGNTMRGAVSFAFLTAL
jgi:hypothetical protein